MLANCHPLSKTSDGTPRMRRDFLASTTIPDTDVSPPRLGSTCTHTTRASCVCRLSSARQLATVCPWSLSPAVARRHSHRRRQHCIHGDTRKDHGRDVFHCHRCPLSCFRNRREMEISDRGAAAMISHRHQQEEERREDGKSPPSTRRLMRSTT